MDRAKMKLDKFRVQSFVTFFEDEKQKMKGGQTYHCNSAPWPCTWDSVCFQIC